MRVASVEEVKDSIQALAERQREDLEWRRLCQRRLERAWEGEEDALYDYL